MAWVFTKARRITKRRHSAEAQAILDRLAAYLHDSESDPVEMLCGFWKDQRDAITYQEMRALILEGYVDEVTARLWQQDYADLVKNRMPQIWNGAMIAGSRSQPLLTSLPNFTFNLQTPGVIRWIQSRGAEMVTASTQRQKDAVALLLEDKMRNAHTVDELARLIRPCIGLHRQQAQAVTNYYNHIVATLTEQHPRTKPERIRNKALEQATKYAERLHRQRAVTIAQTEMAYAYNYGADEGIRQAQADFLIGRCEKIWTTSGDDRVCPDCAALDGQRIGMEDTFFSGNRVVYDENGLYPPRHPRCACAVQYVEIEPPITYQPENRPVAELGISAAGMNENTDFSEFSSLTMTDNDGIISLTRPENEPEFLRQYNRYELGTKTEEEKLAQINPNYASGEPQWRNNCQRCVVAYEMVERGYDVTALPYDEKDPFGYAVTRAFDVPAPDLPLTVKDTYVIQGDAKAFVQKLFDGWGSDARAFMRVMWDKQLTGTEYYIPHVFVVKKINGEIVYLDPQLGVKRDIDDTLSKCAERAFQWIMRVDDKDFSELVTYAVQNRGG